MKLLKPIFLLIISISFVSAQKTKSIPKSNNVLQKLVATEQAFSKASETKGTKNAFLEFLADDAITFNPTETNGKLFWQNRPESPAWLNWSPAWADVSSDGSFGYTTGGWSFHPKGKTGEAAGFGEYLSIWKKQSDGTFKAILDIGVSHEKPANQIKTWKSPTDAGTGALKVEKSIKLDALTDIFSKELLSQGYFNYLAEDVVVLRDGHEPFYGKTKAFVGLEKADRNFPKQSFLNFKADVSPVYGNMMYSKGIYQLTHKDKTISRWNFTQVWKYRNNKWQIVVDVFSEVKENS
jgi:ketosteroid isomerase-like protein